MNSCRNLRPLYKAALMAVVALSVCPDLCRGLECYKCWTKQTPNCFQITDADGPSPVVISNCSDEPRVVKGPFICESFKYFSNGIFVNGVKGCAEKTFLDCFEKMAKDMEERRGTHHKNNTNSSSNGSNHDTSPNQNGASVGGVSLESDGNESNSTNSTESINDHEDGQGENMTCFDFHADIFTSFYIPDCFREIGQILARVAASAGRSGEDSKVKYRHSRQLMDRVEYCFCEEDLCNQPEFARSSRPLLPAASITFFIILFNLLFLTNQT